MNKPSYAKIAFWGSNGGPRYLRAKTLQDDYNYLFNHNTITGCEKSQDTVQTPNTTTLNTKQVYP